MTELTQENVFIRPLTIEDALISYQWRNDPEVWRFTGNRPNRRITQEIETEWAKKVLGDESSYRFAICVREDEDVHYIGNVQLTNVSETEGEYHIFIGNKDYWGRGIATIATQLLVSFAFDEIRLQAIKLRVREDNTAAIRVYNKSGFVADNALSLAEDETDGVRWLVMVKRRHADGNTPDRNAEQA